MTTSQKFSSILSFDKPTKLAAFVSGLAALLLLISFYFAYRYYPEYLSDSISQNVNRGILTEFNTLTEARDRIFEDVNIQKAAEISDGQTLVSLLGEARVRESIGPMSVVDKDGFVISRTRYSQSRGDNIFLETAIGRRMAMSQENVASIEESTLSSREILFITGRYFKKEDKNQGALFATYIVDDVFAKRFATTYIGPSARIAFYTNQYGISGSNIPIQRNRDILDSNIHANPDWSTQVSDHFVFRLEGARIFMMKHIQLKGTESTFGGIVVFMPLTPLIVGALLVIIIPFIIFILTCLILHGRSHRKWAYKTALLLGFTGVISTVVFFYIFFKTVPVIKDGHYPLYNSTLRLQPESGVYNSEFEQKVSILLDSGGESVNVIGLTLKYDPAVAEIKSVDTEKSLCQFFIQNKIENGSFTLECGLPNPGFRGVGGIIADVYIRGKKNDVSLFKFSEDTEVLANDGLGTNVLRQAAGGSYAFNKILNSTSSLSFNVISSSHPNAERWYKSRDIRLSWLPQVPVTVKITDVLGNSKETTFLKPIAFIHADSDGTHKISVSQLNGSGSTTLMVNVDSVPPNDVVLKASETIVGVGDIVRFEIQAKDSLSGLQRTSYLRIDDKLFFPIGNQIHIPFYEKGTYRVTLRAYDNAGNYAEDTVEIRVKA